MPLTIVFVLASAIYVISYRLALNKNWVIALFGAIFYLIYFFVPYLYYATDFPLSIRASAYGYQTDVVYLSNIFIAYFILIALLSLLAIRFSWSEIVDRINPKNSPMRFSFGVSFLVSAVWLVYSTYETFGSVSTDLLGMSRSEFRLATYQDGFAGDAGFIENIFKIIFFVSLSRFDTKSKLFKFIFFYSFALELLSIGFGSLHRSPLVIHMASYLLYWNYFVKPIKSIKLLIVLGVVVFPVIMAGLASFRAYNEFLISDRYVSNVTNGLTGLATAYESYVLKDAIDNGIAEYDLGLQLYNNIIAVVPRILWSGKPNVSFSSRYSEIIYGRVGVGGAWVHTFSVYGEAYAQFGYFGIYLYTFIFVIILYLMLILWQNFSSLSLPILILIVSSPLFLRTDLFAFVSRIYPILIVATALYLSYKVSGSRKKFSSLVIKRSYCSSSQAGLEMPSFSLRRSGSDW